MAKLPLIRDADALAALVMEVGFLPLVPCGVEGFSVQDCTPADRWFVKDVEGPWEWRETIADRGQIAYGKLFACKAGFISPTFYPDFVNWRRNGQSFRARYEAGFISRNEKEIMSLLETNGPMLSRDLKAQVGTKGFDRAVTLLQMRTDITVQRLEYNRDAFGRPYGWGITRFAPSETVFGHALVEAQFGTPPELSRQRLANHIATLFPSAPEQAILRVLRW